MIYLVKYTFSTVKPYKKNGINGKMGRAETEITTDVKLDILKSKYIKEVKAACFNSIKNMAKVIKMGKIIDIDIESITPK